MVVFINGGGIGVFVVDCFIDFGGMFVIILEIICSFFDVILFLIWLKVNLIDIIGDVKLECYVGVLEVLFVDLENDVIFILNVLMAVVGVLDVVFIVVNVVKKDWVRGYW